MNHWIRAIGVGALLGAACITTGCTGADHSGADWITYVDGQSLSGWKSLEGDTVGTWQTAAAVTLVVLGMVFWVGLAIISARSTLPEDKKQ